MEREISAYFGKFWPILAITSGVCVLFGVLSTGLDNVVVYQNGQIWGMIKASLRGLFLHVIKFIMFKIQIIFFRQDVWACCQRNTIMTRWSRGELLFTVWTPNTKITALLSKIAFQFQSFLLQALSLRSEEEKHGACAPSQLKRPGGQRTDKHIFRFPFSARHPPQTQVKTKFVGQL